MVKSVDTADSKSAAEKRDGSSPSQGTKYKHFLTKSLYLLICLRGGIGRHAGLRSQYRKV